MKISRLALHKLDLLFGSPQHKNELKFIETYLKPQTECINCNGLTLSEVERYCSKVEEFGALVLGLETLYESKYGLHVYIFEEYYDVYQNGWWLMALADLQRRNVADCIIPRIEIPAEVIKNYPC